MGIKSLKKLFKEVIQLERENKFLKDTLKHSRYWSCINYFVRLECVSHDTVISLLRENNVHDFLLSNIESINFDSKLNVCNKEHNEFRSIENFIIYLKKMRDAK